MNDLIILHLSKNGKVNAGKYEAIIDSKYSDLINLRWWVHTRNYTNYAYTQMDYPNRKSIYLHRMIMELEVGHKLQRNQQIDHINHDGLDCRIENLRFATQSNNNANTQIRSDNTSGFKGVSFDKRRNKWYAQIGYNGKHLFLGYFPTAEDAFAKYCAEGVKLYGDFFYDGSRKKE